MTSRVFGLLLTIVVLSGTVRQAECLSDQEAVPRDARADGQDVNRIIDRAIEVIQSKHVLDTSLTAEQKKEADEEFLQAVDLLQDQKENGISALVVAIEEALTTEDDFVAMTLVNILSRAGAKGRSEANEIVSRTTRWSVEENQKRAAETPGLEFHVDYPPDWVPAEEQTEDQDRKEPDGP